MLTWKGKPLADLTDAELHDAEHSIPMQSFENEIAIRDELYRRGLSPMQRALSGLMATRQALVKDLTPILGELHAERTADLIMNSAINAAKKKLGVTNH